MFQAAYTRSKWIGTCCDDSGDGGPAIPIPQYTYLNRALMGARPSRQSPHERHLRTALRQRQTVRQERRAAAVLGGWQINGVFSALLRLAVHGLVERHVAERARQFAARRPGEAGRRLHRVNIDQWFDPTAFAPVTTARFGTAGFNILRGPGVVNLDLGIFREFAITRALENASSAAEALNATNTPHFANPGANVSNLSLNSDGSVRSLGGFSTITGVSAPSRLTDERYLRLGLRISF